MSNDYNIEMDNISQDMDQSEDNDKPNLSNNRVETNRLGSQLSTAWDELIKEKDSTLEALHYWIGQHNKLIMKLYTSHLKIEKYSNNITIDKDVEINIRAIIKEMKKANKLWKDSKFCATVLSGINIKQNDGYCHEECYIE